ncbi:substrate-binding periplasmic protein [Vibrio marisflavi]|uniref:Solute-binding protein family 3/N-terminal domain-containing protein n=1 Tax=Vibrio marisflavi CECT 7928 TaxID=634439 RepID=A0ABN8E6M5_9VIBR|nr:transporter substrate-binding domain-containing protein [Vibrio marisflavi]CAH0539473.1 hypothetical protein VMF7928_02172 [Vibrio marisflavi CECT 7928]
MSVNNIWTLLIFVAVFIGFNTSVRAELPSDDPWAGLTFITEEYPPFNYKGADGKLTGLSVETLIAAAKGAGSELSVDDILILPWARGYRMAENDKNVVLFTTSRKPKREKLFLWAGPLSKGSPSVLLARKDRGIKIKDVKDLYKYRIGVIRGDSLENRVKALGGPDKNIIKVHSGELLAEQLEKGRVDFWAFNLQGAIKILDTLNIPKSDFEIVYRFPFNDNYLAINTKTSPKMVEKLQKALDNFKKTSDYQQLLKKYNHNTTSL